MKFTSTMIRIAELASRLTLKMQGVDVDWPGAKTMIRNSIRASEGSAGNAGSAIGHYYSAFGWPASNLTELTHTSHTRCEFSEGEPKVFGFPKMPCASAEEPCSVIRSRQPQPTNDGCHTGQSTAKHF